MQALSGGSAVGGPSTWGDPAPGPPLPSTRYIAPPDITAKWGASRLPGVPSKLHMAPQKTPLELLVARRPFLRYTDFLTNTRQTTALELGGAPETAPVPRPAQLAVRRG